MLCNSSVCDINRTGWERFKQMQSYPLDLVTLLHLLSQQEQSGSLRASIRQLQGIRTAGEAYVMLSRGKIMMCTINDRAGRKLIEGNEALQALVSLGRLEWVWTVRQDDISLERAQPTINQDDDASPVPRRMRGRSLAFHTLPRHLKRVLLLVDGIRTVHMIAMLLPGMSHEELLQSLHELQELGIIEVEK